MKRILLSAALVAICLAALAGVSPAQAQSGNTWTIDYFNNTDWAGYPVMTQYSPYISFNWGTGSPSPAVPADNFSARMTSDAFFYAGTYQFSAVADDVVDARIYMGIHFRFADEGARRMGKQAANWAFSHVLRPLD